MSSREPTARALVANLGFVLVLASIACAEPPRPAAPARRDRMAEIRRAIDGIDARSFGEDVARLEGQRNATDPTHAESALAFVEAELTRAGFSVGRQDVRGRGKRAARAGQNVVAERPGRAGSGSAVVLASAHLDTVPGSPGADDNASGIAALLAIARAAKDVPTELSVRLVAFALEEEGLVGSRYYVRTLGAAERARIVAVYNFDMIAFTRRDPGSQQWPPHSDVLADMRGRPLPPAATFIGAATIAEEADPRDTPMRALHEAQAFVPHLHVETLELPPLLLRFAPDLARGDHAPFWAARIPAVAIGDTAELRNPHYHAPSDTLETLDLRFGALVARWAAAGVLIAARPL